MMDDQVEYVAVGGNLGAIAVSGQGAQKGLEIIQGWTSLVSGELFLTEREAIARDNELLKKYNQATVKEGFNEAFTQLEQTFKKGLSESLKEGDLARNGLLRDLSQAVFDRRLSRSNRYIGVNPFKIMFDLELYADRFVTGLAKQLSEAANDLGAARKGWSLDNLELNQIKK